MEYQFDFHASQIVKISLDRELLCRLNPGQSLTFETDKRVYIVNEIVPLLSRELTPYRYTINCNYDLSSNKKVVSVSVDHVNDNTKLLIRGFVLSVALISVFLGIRHRN